jgi:hypothetical protein
MAQQLVHRQAKHKKKLDYDIIIWLCRFFGGGKRERMDDST